MSTSSAHRNHLYNFSKDYCSLPKPTKLARIQKREFTRSLTRGTLMLDYAALPATPTAVGPIAITLPQYPGVLARCAEGALVFSRAVPVINRRPLRGAHCPT